MPNHSNDNCGCGCSAPVGADGYQNWGVGYGGNGGFGVCGGVYGGSVVFDGDRGGKTMLSIGVLLPTPRWLWWIMYSVQIAFVYHGNKKIINIICIFYNSIKATKGCT